MMLSENNRKARVYRLTSTGRKRLISETRNWQQFALAIRRLLQPA
jgi:DNA-binding PadR family transcriptional regulator